MKKGVGGTRNDSWHREHERSVRRAPAQSGRRCPGMQRTPRSGACRRSCTSPHALQAASGHRAASQAFRKLARALGGSMAAPTRHRGPGNAAQLECCRCQSCWISCGRASGAQTCRTPGQPMLKGGVWGGGMHARGAAAARGQRAALRPRPPALARKSPPGQPSFLPFSLSHSRVHPSFPALEQQLEGLVARTRQLARPQPSPAQPSCTGKQQRALQPWPTTPRCRDIRPLLMAWSAACAASSTRRASTSERSRGGRGRPRWRRRGRLLASAPAVPPPLD